MKAICARNLARTTPAKPTSKRLLNPCSWLRCGKSGKTARKSPADSPLGAALAPQAGAEAFCGGHRLQTVHTSLQYNRLNKFIEWLAGIRVLDPACGSGNFLYVSLQLLLGLEKEVISFGTEIDVLVEPRVGVQQLKAIEINPYAFELAQVSVQIGYLQWRRDNGFDNDRSPVLQNLDGFQNEDALLVPHFRNKAKTLKEAQAGEHASDDALKFYTERDWPKCDAIVGNPPFLGGKMIRRELGDSYVDALFENLGKRVPPSRPLLLLV